MGQSAVKKAVAEEQAVVHSTFVVERSYPKPPEVVFAAFATPEKKRQWWAQGDAHDILEYMVDFRVGGGDRLVYQFRPGHPIAGKTITNEVTYEDIVGDRRIVMAQGMSLDDKRISAALVTVELLPTETGTDLILTHQGAFLEWEGGSAMLEQGWNALMDRLGKQLGS